MNSGKKGLRYIQEIDEYSRDLLEKKDLSNIDVKDILGFKVPNGANAFLPYAKCVPLKALIPIYDTLIVGLHKGQPANNLDSFSTVESQTGFNLNEIIELAQHNKIIIYIDVDCVDCMKEMAKIVEILLDNDVKLFLGGSQAKALAYKAANPAGLDFESGEKLVDTLSPMLMDEKFKQKLLKLQAGIPVDKGKSFELNFRRTTLPIQICSVIKPTSEYVKQLIELGKKGKSPDELLGLADRLFIAPELFLAKALNSTLSTNTGCRHINLEQNYEKSAGVSIGAVDPFELEFIQKKLKIAYTDEIPFSQYLEIFSSNTTQNIREITRKIITEAKSKAGSILALQNTVDLYNEQITEIVNRSTNRSKIVFATSDIIRSNLGALKLVTQGVTEKYLNTPEKAWDCAAIPDKYRQSMSRWLGKKVIGLESMLAGVSPDVIHLYNVRTCIDKIKIKEV